MEDEIRNFKPLTMSYDCTARFVSDLVGKPNCWFSHAHAHMEDEMYNQVLLHECFICLFINSYGHVGTLSQLNGTFPQNNDAMSSKKCFKYNHSNKPEKLICTDGLT